MTTNTLRLFDIAEEYLQALDELLAIDDLPDEVITDTMESLSGDFEVKAKNTGFYIQNLEAEAKAIDEAEKRMKARKQSLTNQAKRLRGYLHNNMEHTGITKINSAELVLKIQNNPASVVVDSEEKIPDNFKAIETLIKVKKSDIAKVLKSGVEVPGAHLKQSTRLVIA